LKVIVYFDLSSGVSVSPSLLSNFTRRQDVPPRSVAALWGLVCALAPQAKASRITANDGEPIHVLFTLTSSHRHFAIFNE
jgi:hypothetical protein